MCTSAHGSCMHTLLPHLTHPNAVPPHPFPCATHTLPPSLNATCGLPARLAPPPTQAIGAEPLVVEECKAMVHQYLPAIVKLINRLPPEGICASLGLCSCEDGGLGVKGGVGGRGVEGWGVGRRGLSFGSGTEGWGGSMGRMSACVIRLRFKSEVHWVLEPLHAVHRGRALLPPPQPLPHLLQPRPPTSSMQRPAQQTLVRACSTAASFACSTWKGRQPGLRVARKLPRMAR
jgi:hypothetical protein